MTAILKKSGCRLIATFDDIFAAAKSLECTAETRRGLQALHGAMTDWPDDFNIVDDFFVSVESYLGEALNSTRVRAKLRVLDVAANAWRAESLSELLIFLDEFECVSAVECARVLKRL